MQDPEKLLRRSILNILAFEAFLDSVISISSGTPELFKQGFQAALTKPVASLGGILNEFYDYTAFTYVWWLNCFLECDSLPAPRRK